MWFLVKWYIKGTTSTRTDWYNGKDRAVRVAKREQDKGNIVTDFRNVSGNGRRQ